MIGEPPPSLKAGRPVSREFGRRGIVRLFGSLHDAHRNRPAVRHVEGLRQHQRGICAAMSESFLGQPLPDKGEDAGPGIIAHLGVAERARVAFLGRRVLALALAGRPRLVLADQVEANRCADDVGLAEQVVVIGVARIQQIAQRQVCKIIAEVENGHRVAPRGLMHARSSRLDAGTRIDCTTLACGCKLPGVRDGSMTTAVRQLRAAPGRSS